MHPFKFHIGIKIISAKYGSNCAGSDQTSNLQRVCDNHETCKYRIDANVIGDPCGGVSKIYKVSYKCSDDSRTHVIEIPGEASGKDLNISCQQGLIGINTNRKRIYLLNLTQKLI